MEIMCDYFIDGYEILYNLEKAEIKNGPQLVNIIEDLIINDNKVLVAVDDVHTQKTTAILYVMDRLSQKKMLCSF